MRRLALLSLFFVTVAYANPELEKALDDGDLQALKGLLDAGVDPNSSVGPYKEPALFYVKKDSLPLVEALLDAGANPNLKSRDGSTALDTTVAFCAVDAARLMVAKGANNNRDNSGMSTLNSAIFRGCTGIAELLVNNGADVNEPDAAAEDRVLTTAISSKNLEATKWLIAHGAKADYSVMGYSLVDLAASSGNAELVEVVKGASQ